MRALPQGAVSDTMQKNLEFQGKAGLHARIVRTYRKGKHGCEYCARLAGSYEYPLDDTDVYRRHANCRCTLEFINGGKTKTLWSGGDVAQQRAQEKARQARLERYNALDAKAKKKEDARREARKRFAENEEMRRRRIGEQGQEIIDKPTYNKLTRDFKRRGGLIIRGEDAEVHLKSQGAYASYINGGNIAFIRDEATVSDVLEEMYHSQQDRKGIYNSSPQDEIVLRREIDAQKYLIQSKKRYKIPIEEIDVTRKNLEMYEKELRRITEGRYE